MGPKSISLLMCLFGLAFLAASLVKYDVGDIVDDFKLKNVDGKMVSLSDFKDVKGVILIFDCNTCPFSKAYNSRIIALNEKYKGKGFPVVTVNRNDVGASPGDSYEEMVKLAKEKNYSFSYLVDETQAIGKLFGATNTPHSFVLKKEGAKFKIVYIGVIDNSARDESKADRKYVEEAVEATIAGKQVVDQKTKAIGCGIKYREN
jgi:glutathione peroxidase-family protein